METIICSAIHYDDGKEYVHQPENIKTGLVISGMRHHNCITTKNETHICRDLPGIQGFITSNHRFVNRVEAREIALSTGQVKTTIHPRSLFSEDLY